MSEGAREARHVEVGDRIMWCGRKVEVIAVEMAKSRGTGSFKPGRRFTVMNDEIGVVSGLHWFYDEPVTYAADPREEEQ